MEEAALDRWVAEIPDNSGDCTRVRAGTESPVPDLELLVGKARDDR